MARPPAVGRDALPTVRTRQRDHNRWSSVCAVRALVVRWKRLRRTPPRPIRTSPEMADGPPQTSPHLYPRPCGRASLYATPQDAGSRPDRLLTPCRAAEPQTLISLRPALALQLFAQNFDARVAEFGRLGASRRVQWCGHVRGTAIRATTDWIGARDAWIPAGNVMICLHSRLAPRPREHHTSDAVARRLRIV